MLQTYDRESGIHAKHLASYSKAAELHTRLSASLKAAAPRVSDREVASPGAPLDPLHAEKLANIIDMARYRRKRPASGAATRRVVWDEYGLLCETG
ncbi:MAG: hypothetical protein AAGJ70_04420 [Pseudomonadota bacterium]